MILYDLYDSYYTMGYYGIDIIIGYYRILYDIILYYIILYYIILFILSIDTIVYYMIYIIL